MVYVSLFFFATGSKPCMDFGDGRLHAEPDADADGLFRGRLALYNGGAALRKMFVAADRRGSEHGVAQRLLETLLAHAKVQGLSTVWLGTTDKFRAAHRFYEKNGFSQVAPDSLPAAFPRMTVDTRFYRINIEGT